MGCLNSMEDYKILCFNEAKKLNNFKSLAEISEAEQELNAYPNLASLSAPKECLNLEQILTKSMIEHAKELILQGKIFWEHTAAGEATRLGLGPKFNINPHIHLIEKYQSAKDLMPASLGFRHLAQHIFELTSLAKSFGLDPSEVLERQKILLIVNEALIDNLFERLLKNNFFGFKSENFYLMVQPSFYGLNRTENEDWFFDETSSQRLHNHGHMAIQKVLDQQIFYLDSNGLRHYLNWRDFLSKLEECKDLVSYNIEDLGYLTKALDYETIGLALYLGDQGYGMTMEIVANNPENPVKGGLYAHDSILKRDVVIESFRLKDIPPSRITFLNKNFNHYPNPAKIFSALKEQGLFMPVTIKENFLYFQPVQGDLNFLTKTAFISRAKPVSILSWKSGLDTPAAIKAMNAQDQQPGFCELYHKYFKEIF